MCHISYAVARSATRALYGATQRPRVACAAAIQARSLPYETCCRRLIALMFVKYDVQPCCLRAVFCGLALLAANSLDMTDA